MQEIEAQVSLGPYNAGTQYNPETGVKTMDLIFEPAPTGKI